jgi:hypothetical protein
LSKKDDNDGRRTREAQPVVPDHKDRYSPRATRSKRGRPQLHRGRTRRPRAGRGGSDEWVRELDTPRTATECSGLHQICGPMLDRLDMLPEPQREALGTVFGQTTSSSRPVRIRRDARRRHRCGRPGSGRRAPPYDVLGRDLRALLSDGAVAEELYRDGFRVVPFTPPGSGCSVPSRERRVTASVSTCVGCRRNRRVRTPSAAHYERRRDMQVNGRNPARKQLRGEPGHLLVGVDDKEGVPAAEGGVSEPGRAAAVSAWSSAFVPSAAPPGCVVGQPTRDHLCRLTAVQCSIRWT